MSKLVCVDFGHKGKLLGQDCGAVGNGLYESDLTEIIGKGIVKELSNYEVDIRIAPRGSLTDRTNYANSINADYFLSIHINSSNNTSATGWESFVHNNASQNSINYQKIIHTEIMSYLKQFNIIDRGMKKANFAVLRQTNMSACLIENLFISNPNDAKLLKDDNFLNGLSNSITNGLVKTLNLQLKIVENEKTKDNKQEDINMALLDWQKKLGTSAIDILSKKGIISNPEIWKDEKNLESPVPSWLFFEIIKRVVEDK